jgi:sugar phosphate isomerase/epimerase
MTLSRRNLLVGSGAALALTACGGGVSERVEATTPVAKRQIEKIGLQTYTFREALGQDFRGTLQMIKDVGYDYVELNERNYAEKTPSELKALLDEIGLPSPATHISYDNLENNVSGLIETAKTLQTEYMILPYIADDQRSLEDWKRHAALLNSAGEKLADQGVKLAYHNHQFEFDDLGGGTTAMEILMNETDPRYNNFELDFFWANLAKQDIPALLRKYPGRFPLSHVKDMKGSPDVAIAENYSYEDIHQKLMVDVGQGDSPFDTYLALNDISGMTYFIAENDGPKKPYRQSAVNMYEGMKSIRF